MAAAVVFECPHCNESIVVQRNEINCAIFRHAIFRDTLEPIDPHASKQTCDALVRDEKVYGCGKPFRLVNDVPEVCDYV